MLVLENKFKNFSESQNSNLIFEENEFIRKFLISIEIELFSPGFQNVIPDFHNIPSNSGGIFY